jgi:hypothetical protein
MLPELPAPCSTIATKVAVLLPTVSMIEAGIVTAGLLLVSVTNNPPASAGLFRVTVQVVPPPSCTADGLQFIDCRPDVAPDGCSVSVAVCVVPDAAADKIAV